jgi:hypothetical protein
VADRPHLLGMREHDLADHDDYGSRSQPITTTGRLRRSRPVGNR